MDQEAIEKLWKDYINNKNQDVKERLIEYYAPVVRVVAGRLSIYLNNYIEIDDLIGYGVIGLIDAVDKFDLAKNVKFETYASLRIRGAIIDEIRKLDWVPRSLRKKQKDFNKVQTLLEGELGRIPTDKEIQTHMGLSDEEYEKMVNETNISSLISIEEQEMQMFEIKDNKIPTPQEEIEKQEMINSLTHAIDKLNEREQLVIKLYYFEELTLKEISKVIEVSESRISQIHTKAVSKLRESLKKQKLIAAI